MYAVKKLSCSIVNILVNSLRLNKQLWASVSKNISSFLYIKMWYWLICCHHISLSLNCRFWYQPGTEALWAACRSHKYSNALGDISLNIIWPVTKKIPPRCGAFWGLVGVVLDRVSFGVWIFPAGRRIFKLLTFLSQARLSDCHSASAPQSECRGKHTHTFCGEMWLRWGISWCGVAKHTHTDTSRGDEGR